jgi:hypothetical protein
MIYKEPSPSAFKRLILGSTSVSLLLAAIGTVDRAHQLNVDLSVSRSWQILISVLLLLSVIGFVDLVLSFASRDKLLSAINLFPQESRKESRRSRAAGWLITMAAVSGPVIVLSFPYVKFIVGNHFWLRFMIFWFFALAGMVGIRMIRGETSWMIALVSMALSQTALHLVISNLSSVSTYPFATGWSESSRYYSPSLFLSQKVYGEQYAWPFQNHALHLILAVPYLFSAPLWFHRFWQVFLSLTLLGVIVRVLMSRLSLKGGSLSWLIGLWMFLFLLIGPVYFHLAFPVIIVLVGFTPEDNVKSGIVVILASLWAGWSRINWFPVPGMLAAVIYLLEVPLQGRNVFDYLRKPAQWFSIGTLVAFVSQRLYIALSGLPEGYFYTSLSSSLLWYRLLPNATYAPGILAAVIFVSLPLLFIALNILRGPHPRLHPARVLLIGAALLILFAGGLVVSVKIGGGADLHNLDAYFILLLVITSYLAFARYRNEDGTFSKSKPLHWAIILLVASSPVAMLLPNGLALKSYDVDRTSGVLEELQRNVDRVSATGGEILFITQRHLISMHMLKDVPLVAEYEREELMEMAMANNREYLGAFRQDLEAQRFDLIIVDPITFSLLGPAYSFGEENNAWVQKIAKHILCNYHEEIVFPKDRIALYVPQVEERQCPVIGQGQNP